MTRAANLDKFWNSDTIAEDESLSLGEKLDEQMRSVESIIYTDIPEARANVMRYIAQCCHRDEVCSSNRP